MRAGGLRKKSGTCEMSAFDPKRKSSVLIFCLHKNSPKEFLKTLSPMGTISDAKDIAEAVVYLTEARHVTGEVLHVDGGAHIGKW
jgi:enoyl-[acyl-carrier-protein] reductase (NADH)